jgi:hypothetical protein
MEIKPYALKNINSMGNSACCATQHKPGVSIKPDCLSSHMSLRVRTFRHVVLLVSIMSGTGVAICTAVVVSSVSWELVYKISCSQVDLLIFYVLLFGVMYLA